MLYFSKTFEVLIVNIYEKILNLRLETCEE